MVVSANRLNSNDCGHIQQPLTPHDHRSKSKAPLVLPHTTSQQNAY